MSKKFLADTYLSEYEMLMQQVPSSFSAEKYRKKARGQYISFLKQYMREYGYGELCGRVIKSMCKMLFDDFLYIDEYHRNIFLKMYHRHTKAYDKTDNLKTAAVYLLSTKSIFRTVLENYITNPIYILPNMVTGSADEDCYSIYHAVKKLLGMDSGLYEEDLFDNQVLSNEVLCLVMNAKVISKYGITGYLRREDKEEKPKYINTPHRHTRPSGIYEYGNNRVRIK